MGYRIWLFLVQILQMQAQKRRESRNFDNEKLSLISYFMWLRCGNRKEIVEREGNYRISNSLVENPNEIRPIRFIDYHPQLPVSSYSSHLLKRQSASNVQKRQSLNKEQKEHFHTDDCNLNTPIFVRI